MDPFTLILAYIFCALMFAAAVSTFAPARPIFALTSAAVCPRCRGRGWLT